MQQHWLHRSEEIPCELRRFFQLPKKYVNFQLSLALIACSSKIMVKN